MRSILFFGRQPIRQWLEARRLSEKVGNQMLFTPRAWCRKNKVVSVFFAAHCPRAHSTRALTARHNVPARAIPLQPLCCPDVKAITLLALFCPCFGTTLLSLPLRKPPMSHAKGYGCNDFRSLTLDFLTGFDVPFVLAMRCIFLTGAAFPTLINLIQWNCTYDEGKRLENSSCMILYRGLLS